MSQCTRRRTGNAFRAAAKVCDQRRPALSANLLRLKAEPAATPMIVPARAFTWSSTRASLQARARSWFHTQRWPRVIRDSMARPHVVGTTDTPIAAATLEPIAMEEEIEFILATAGQYLAKAPTRDGRVERFRRHPPSGARNGRANHGGPVARFTSSHIDRSGLITISGGK